MSHTPTPVHAATWFEIPCLDLDRSQNFYETVLGRPLRRETMGPNTLAVFPYAEEGAGGCLYVGATMLAPASSGTLVYLDCSPSLDAALARVLAAGGQVASPRVELPPGMGCIAHIIDPAGNRVGLHAEG